MSNFYLWKDRSRAVVMAALVATIQALSSAKVWHVEIKAYRKTRSNEQNRALWGLAYPILRDATGSSVNECHKYMLEEYFGRVEYTIFGRIETRPARTTTTGYEGEDNTLSTEEFARFFDFIQQRAAENNIAIPDPDPFWREQKAA